MFDFWAQDVPPFYTLKESSECGGSETYEGFLYSVEECAQTCEAKSASFFIYGKLESTECNSDGKCNCYCQMTESCTIKDNAKFDLYVFGYGNLLLIT